MADNSISLNKFISETGICSRREADEWIDAGRVCINKIIAKKGNRVYENDLVTIDGNPLIAKPELVYIAFHKPIGITCTTDLKDKDNIIDFINHPKRIFPIGRLDKSSTGLIFLTNDGDIVNEILRVENNHEKEYIVTVDRPTTQKFIQDMSTGVPILNTITKKCFVENQSKFVFRIILTQGLNRQIRRMCAFLDFRVVALKRVRIMNVKLDGIGEGQWRELTPEEFQTMKENFKKD